MLFPIRTDRYPKRRPLVTECLIAANVLIYLAGLIGRQAGSIDLETMAAWGHFDPRAFTWWQVFTSQFLHSPSSMWHVVFNMLALWVFGPPVEGRLGRLGFLSFYLMAGVVANIAHMIVSPAPVIGASGAIAGVTGIFLALFPRSHVICFYIFSGGLIVVSSLWFIGLYFVIDVLRQTRMMLGGPSAGIAYMAHIAGYAYGFATGFALLGLKVIPREEWDVFFLFKQWRRRAALRAANKSSPAGAWDAPTADTGKRLLEKKARQPDLNEADAAIAEARAEIHHLAALHDLPRAAAKYRHLLAQHPAVALSEQRQLEIANQLASEGDHASAAAAYELLLERYPRISGADEVRLLLALLYARNLRQPGRARELLEAARSRLQDATQQQLAEQILMELPQ